VKRTSAVWLVVAAATLLAVGLGVRELVKPSVSDAPVPVPWDKASCEGCRMLLSEPSFAVQVHRDDGEILFFDDPGEALLWLESHPTGVHEAWFHHRSEDRWLALSEVGFERAQPTPMGYGLAAVDARTPGALTLEQATTEARAVERERGSGP